jgi:hypothetical protein
LLADVAALTTSATSGPSTPDSFAHFNPDGSWRKTCQGFPQVTLDGSLERFSETWPRAGMTRNGIAYLRPPSAPLTDGTESGSLPTWPTPTSRDHKDGTAQSCRNVPTNGLLGRVIHQRESLPTSTAIVVSGSLNPTWVEWLMGYPLEWTVLKDWATPSSRKSRNGSRGAS